MENKLSNLTREIFETELNEDIKQVAVTVACYITKTLSGRTNCTDFKLKLIANEKCIEHVEYLNLLPHGDFTTPCSS